MTEQEFSQFYKNNINKVFRFIYLRVDKIETAQDLTAQAFLKCWQKASLRGVPQKRDDVAISNPTAFVYQVARNQIIDFYRQKNKTPISLEELKEKAELVKYDKKYLSLLKKTKVVFAKLVRNTPLLRHDPKKLAKVIERIIHYD